MRRRMNFACFSAFLGVEKTRTMHPSRLRCPPTCPRDLVNRHPLERAYFTAWRMCLLGWSAISLRYVVLTSHYSTVWHASGGADWSRRFGRSILRLLVRSAPQTRLSRRQAVSLDTRN